MFIGIIAMRSVAEQPRSDEEYMALALDEAALAAAEDEVPVGAVLVGGDGTVLARGRNRREELADPTAHAEIEALRSGSPGSGGWRREGATLYVTLEPCPMCMGALVLARVRRVVFGATDPKAGAAVSLYELGSDSRLNHQVEMTGGVLAEECSQQLKLFFQELRARRAADKN